MTHHIPSVCAAAAISILAVLPADQVLADTLVASWNLKHLGWNQRQGSLGGRGRRFPVRFDRPAGGYEPRGSARS